MSSEKRISLICYTITFIEFLAILLWGTIGSIVGDEMGYSLLCFYMIMPVTSLVIAFVLGLKNAYFKWLYPFMFGLFAFVIPIIVFGNSWHPQSLFFSFIPSMLGLIIGLLIYKMKNKFFAGQK